MEAFASFGGCDLGSALRKSETLREKLEKQKEALKQEEESGEPKSKRSRYIN